LNAHNVTNHGVLLPVVTATEIGIGGINPLAAAVYAS
jgi:hypothetical protein